MVKETNSTQGSSPFLNLPLEIRRKIYNYSAYDKPPIEVHYLPPFTSVQRFLPTFKGEKVTPLAIAIDQSYVTLSTGNPFMRVCKETSEDTLSDTFNRMHVFQINQWNLSAISGSSSRSLAVTSRIRHCRVNVAIGDEYKTFCLARGAPLFNDLETISAPLRLENSRWYPSAASEMKWIPVNTATPPTSSQLDDCPETIGAAKAITRLMHFLHQFPKLETIQIRYDCEEFFEGNDRVVRYERLFLDDYFALHGGEERCKESWNRMLTTYLPKQFLFKHLKELKSFDTTYAMQNGDCSTESHRYYGDCYIREHSKAPVYLGAYKGTQGRFRPRQQSPFSDDRLQYFTM